MLDSNYYSIKNALNYQIFTGHAKEVLGQGKLVHRAVHLIIAALEITPIIGQIIALFELAIVKAFSSNAITPKSINPIKATTSTIEANTLLLPFYQSVGVGPGCTLQDIWKFTDDQLEDCHNYIQWLFPSMKPSAHNPNAPVLGNAKGPGGKESLLDALKKDPKVRANLEKSFDVMLKFYGLRYDPKAKLIFTNPNFEDRMGVWMTPGNHNFLRITRILSCLKHFGMHERSKAFFDFLVSMRWSQKSQAITAETVKRWSQAIH